MSKEKINSILNRINESTNEYLKVLGKIIQETNFMENVFELSKSLFTYEEREKIKSVRNIIFFDKESKTLDVLIETNFYYLHFYMGIQTEDRIELLDYETFINTRFQAIYVWGFLDREYSIINCLEDKPVPFSEIIEKFADNKLRDKVLEKIYKILNDNDLLSVKNLMGKDKDYFLLLGHDERGSISKVLDNE